MSQESEYFSVGYTLDAAQDCPCPCPGSLQTLPEAADRCEELLVRQLETGLAGRKNAALLLSGGIDSGVLAALCHRHRATLGVDHAVTVRFQLPQYDESPLARQCAAATGMELHGITLTAEDALHHLRRLMADLPKPFADSSLPATYAACAEAAAPLIITGDGGDELFGGYRRYNAMLLRQRLIPAWLEPLSQRLCSALAAILPREKDNRGRYATLRRLLVNFGMTPAQAYVAFQAITSKEQRNELLPGDDNLVLERLAQRLLMDDSQQLPWYNRFDLMYYLPCDGMRKSAIAAKAAGVELISPILAQEVRDFALSLPRPLRFNCRQGKLVLRELARRYLPDAIVHAPKRGFGLPIAQWFRQEWRELISTVVQTIPQWESSGRLSQTTARRLCQQHLDGTRNNAPFLWALLAAFLHQQTP